jgi:hypothetical protein
MQQSKKAICMKKNILIIALILGAALAFLPSCDNSGYPLSNFRVGIATVVPVGQHSYSLLLDNGKSLWVAAADVRYSPRENQRVFVNYTLLSDRYGEYDHFIKINDIWNILTKQAIELTAQNADSIGHDPIRVNEMWAGGDFLNISFMFNWSGTRPHLLNLVENSTAGNTSTDVIELEFRHNAYGSTATRALEGFVCFDLRPFQIEGQNEVKFAIKVKEPAGERIIDVVYRYNRAVPEATANMPMPVITSNEYY